MRIGLAYNFVTKELALIVILSVQFVAYRLTSVFSPEAKSWRPQIQEVPEMETVVTQWLLTSDTG
jgi:hypothetical protein